MSGPPCYRCNRNNPATQALAEFFGQERSIFSLEFAARANLHGEELYAKQDQLLAAGLHRGRLYRATA